MCDDYPRMEDAREHTIERLKADKAELVEGLKAARAVLKEIADITKAPPVSNEERLVIYADAVYTAREDALIAKHEHKETP